MYFIEARTSKKELVLSSDMLKPGDLISWTRMLTYDHYALVKRVLGPNLIEVFEFTTRTGNKIDGKTYKRSAKLQIFDGYDPVYKITQTPPENPEVVILTVTKDINDSYDNNTYAITITNTTTTSTTAATISITTITPSSPLTTATHSPTTTTTTATTLIVLLILLIVYYFLYYYLVYYFLYS